MAIITFSFLLVSIYRRYHTQMTDKLYDWNFIIVNSAVDTLFADYQFLNGTLWSRSVILNIWAIMCLTSVSYTHLDVYKRQ